MNLLRWALFFARSWVIPFFMGSLTVAVITTYQLTEFSVLFTDAFDQAFQSFIASCSAGRS